MYYSDKELSTLDSNKKDFDTQGLQRELSNRGYKFPKSTKSDGTFDGIYGPETKQALLDYQSKNAKSKLKNGGWLDGLSNPNNVIEDNRGQWAHPGKVTKINSNQITMKGVNYPVLGVSDSGDTQMMKPGGEYNFKGKTVTEYPQKFQLGGNFKNVVAALASNIPKNRLDAEAKEEAKRMNQVWTPFNNPQTQEVYQQGPNKGKPTGKGALEPSYPELMLMPGSLPIKAASKMGKVAVGVAEALNPIGGMIALKNKAVAQGAKGLVSDAVKYAEKKSVKPATASTTVKSVEPSFKSEIDWAKWNKEIPENKALMQEYNTIEETSKANGTWMKNSDGSAFTGTPEQFVQQNSSNFKNAFPEGATNTFRGSGVHNPELRNNKDFRSVFTGDYNLARAYGNAYSNKNYQNYFNPNIPTGEELLLKNNPFKNLETARLDPKNRNLIRAYSQSEDAGVYNLYSKNTKKNIRIDAKGADWKKLPQQDNLPYLQSNDDVGKYLDANDLDQAFIKNVHDGVSGDVLIAAHKNGNYLKSAVGNNGMFDMTNPNIYKGLVSATLGTAALQQNKKQNGGWLDKKNN
jgi:hypothetical protein